jgi:hypothetical protein
LKENQILWEGEFGLSKTNFLKNIQKIKNFSFLKKNYNSKKRILQLFSTTVFFLAYPTSEKNLAKIIWVKKRFMRK